jgi:hypothetical protein
MNEMEKALLAAKKEAEGYVDCHKLEAVDIGFRAGWDACDSRTAELRRQLEDAEKFINVFADGTCHESTHDSLGDECGCAYTRVRETALAYRSKYPKALKEMGE